MGSLPKQGHAVDSAAPWVTAGILLLLYGPVLRLGPVAEDLQWALKGWVTPFHPNGWLRPFHDHLRPAGRAFFTVGANLFGDHWVFYRLATLVVAAILIGIAYAYIKRDGRLGGALAALAVLLWFGSPLVNEALFATNLVTQMLYSTGVVLVLFLRGRPDGGAWWQLSAAAALAFAAKEEAVILVLLVVAQDLILFRRSMRTSIRHAVPWVVATAVYLAGYRVLVDFRARWFYADPWLAVPNLATTWTAFWHLRAPVLADYSRALRTFWPLAALAGALTVGALLLARARDDRVVPFFAVAAVLALAPTLPANLQAPRYTFLGYLFFTVFALRAGKLLTELVGSRAVRVALLAIVVVIAAGDLVTTHGDLSDWERFSQLTARLDGELNPVLDTLRAGQEAVLIRGSDRAPLTLLLWNHRGYFKLYFPRPDDPYGVTSVSALASWRLRREGIVALRVAAVRDQRQARTFVHTTKGFRLLSPGSVHLGRRPARGVVILRPIPAAGFDPEAFW